MKNLLTLIAIVLIYSNTNAQVTTIVLQPGPLNGIDAHLFENSPNTNFGNHTDFISYVWTFGGVEGEGKSLLMFDLSQIPMNANIISAKLSLFYNPTSSNNGHYGDNKSLLLMVTSSWNESTVTWNSIPSTTNADSILLPSSITTTQDYPNIDVTTQVTKWHSGIMPNYGFLLEPVIKTTLRSMKFSSSDHANPNLRPKLEIIYDTTTSVVPCPYYHTNNQFICEGDSIYLQNGWQKNPGVFLDTLTSITGPDSIIITSLHLHPEVNNYLTVTICDGDSILINGAFRHVAGIYSETHPSYLGCDSTVITSLFVEPNQIIVDAKFICSGDSILVGGGYQHLHGFYYDTFTGSNGCDSTIITQLGVISVDTTLTIIGDTLKANQSGATYQWVDCEFNNTPIPGATQQSFTPTANGYYAVIITLNGCPAMSPCINITNVSAAQPISNHSIRLVPNPSVGSTTIYSSEPFQSATLVIRTIDGKDVYNVSVSKGNKVDINTSQLEKGVYLISILTEAGTQTSKLIVE